MDVCNFQLSAYERYIVNTATIRFVYISRSYVFHVVWNVLKREGICKKVRIPQQITGKLSTVYIISQ